MGIGNQMFIYAAMYGLAKTNKKTPIIKKSHPYPLKEYFTLSIPEYDGDVKFVTVSWYYFYFMYLQQRNI